ncbi:Histone-lysine N-methyltransferase ASHR3 [Glycine max]|nr:Histone-lysine N-methyltransferase ASHR3 [Glycine max]
MPPWVVSHHPLKITKPHFPAHFYLLLLLFFSSSASPFSLCIFSLPSASVGKFPLRVSAMPDLGNLSLSAPLTLSRCSSNDALDAPVKTLPNAFSSEPGSEPAFEPRVLKRTRGSLDRVKKPPIADKAFQDRLKDLPFLVGAPMMTDASTSDISEVFCRLPLPFISEEFKIDFTWKDMDNKMEQPSPYVHIRRIKKKRSDADDGAGCTSCSSTSTCSDDCVCRVQCISCSKACRCSENCNNRPFRKEKKIKIVKTELCGWGVEAAETIDKGGFIIEYIGEVIDDALCEKRLWDMKYRGVQNFYMCEIRKDFTIDATFKGNTSRFLNHSCDPNCVLEKWQVDGETRVGVFAACSIEAGEPLTYDYRFVQFGPEVKCHCGAANCQGFLGTKKKIGKLDLYWGSKRKRTSKASCITILILKDWILILVYYQSRDTIISIYRWRMMIPQSSIYKKGEFDKHSV